MTETLFRARSRTRAYLTGEVAVHALRDLRIQVNERPLTAAAWTW